MPDYAMIKINGDINAAKLDSEVKTQNQKIKGISVIHYSIPRVAILHCESEILSSEEILQLQQIIDQHTALD